MKNNTTNNKSYKNKSNKNKSNLTKLIMIAASALVLLAITFSINKPETSSESTTINSNAEKVIDADIKIPVSEITETAKFFPAEINGTDLEVIAVKAPDGTIRTAFNTCQVCYSSGRGYYEQEGDLLVCQNCGNQFTMDQVEIVKGGCNPVPITEENKTVDDSTITVSKDFLTEATAIFENWK